MLTRSRPSRHSLWFTFLLALLLVLLALLLIHDAAAAQAPVTPAHTDPNWNAAYWDNTGLIGTPVVERSDATLDFNWASGSPDARLPADHFSARWLRYIDVAARVYRFTATSDDGIRVYIDDHLIIDQWTIHAEATFAADIALAEGHHLLRVEYFEDEGLARAQVAWQPATEVTSGAWRGEYYDNRTLSGNPAFIRYDDNIDFDWSGSPRSGEIGADDFSVRWTRTLNVAQGRYRFHVTVDDGVRLYVNGHLLIDKWFDQAATTYREEIYLPTGNIPLQLEYYEHEDRAQVRLTWERTDSDQRDDAHTEGDWRAEYYDNEWLGGSPSRVRLDPEIDFNWGSRAPMGGIGRDYFSVRWTQTIYFEEGRYRFTTETDDGVRLYLDNNLIIDAWQRMARDEYHASRTLSRGDHTLRMEYFEATGNAYAKLSWERVEDEEEETAAVGNIITCVPPQPANCAWIKVYRLDANGTWIDISAKGYASCVASGYLKIDGLLVDTKTFGPAGHPYRVEQWVNGQLIYSTGNFQAGEPTFLVRPFTNNYTPWQCTP